MFCLQSYHGLKDLSIDEMVGAWCFGCLSGPTGFTCWLSFAPVTVESLSLLDLCFVLIHIWTKGEVGAPLNRLKLSSKIFYWPFQGSTSFVDLLCFSVLCLLCICMRMFICALLSPAGKGLTSWLSFVVSSCEFVTFPLVSWVKCGTWLYRFLIFAP